MAKPNYQHEKRLKDLARKKKQEEKRLKKLNKGSQPSEESSEQTPPDKDGNPPQQ